MREHILNERSVIRWPTTSGLGYSIIIDISPLDSVKVLAHLDFNAYRFNTLMH